MILLDVNVLVYAFHADEPLHPPTRAWLEATLDSGELIGLTESTVSGFLRIVTNPRIYSDPAPTAAAAAFVDALVTTGRTSWLSTNQSVWSAFREIADDDRQLRGNLVPDAWLAAVAHAHGARIATADRGFARFPGVELLDPTA